MRFVQTLKSLWLKSTSYLLAQDVPTFTRSIADGVRLVSTKLLLMLASRLDTLPPRLVICLMLIALWLLGAWII